MPSNTTTRSRGKAKSQDQATPTQEETPTPTTQEGEEAPQVPQDQAKSTPTPTQETQAPKAWKAPSGGWDALACWVAWVLFTLEPSYQEKGVTSSQVASVAKGMTQEVFTFLVTLGAIPKGCDSLETFQGAMPQTGWDRAFQNNLWRVSQEGDKGEIIPLIRNSGSRVTFTPDPSFPLGEIHPDTLEACQALAALVK